MSLEFWLLYAVTVFLASISPVPASGSSMPDAEENRDGVLLYYIDRYKLL
jgi:hypothetical protein